MASASSLEIKVIYDARWPGRRGPVVRPRGRTASQKSTRLGLLNLAVAGALYYGTWWSVDPYLSFTLIWKTPLEGVDTDVTGFLVPAGSRTLPANEAASPALSDAASPRYTGKRAAVTMAAVAYGWLALSSISFVALAFAAGASFARSLRVPMGRVGLLLSILLVLGVALLGYGAVQRYGTIQPFHVRVGMGGLALLGGAVGLAFARRALFWSRFAGVAVIVAALGSVAGLYLWAQCGAVAPGQFTLWLLPVVFVVHSLYGWAMFPLSKRWVR